MVAAKASRVARVISIFSWVGWKFLVLETGFWFWERVWAGFARGRGKEGWGGVEVVEKEVI